jgi:enoyl-CoA hydratase/carnithine racemase
MRRSGIMEGLLEALPRLARDSAVGVIVLTGTGRAFCAGGDVKSMGPTTRHQTRSVGDDVISIASDTSTSPHGSFRSEGHVSLRS